MIRLWSSLLVCVGLMSMVGCSGDDRDSQINNVNTQISAVATSVGYITDKLNEFVKKKEGDAKDEEAAKKDLDEAVAEAKKLRETAKELQKLSTNVARISPATDAEKKEFLDRHLKRINQTRDELLQSHRQLKTALAEANKKYEETLTPLMQALAEAEGEFAAIVRKR